MTKLMARRIIKAYYGYKDECISSIDVVSAVRKLGYLESEFIIGRVNQKILKRFFKGGDKNVKTKD